jgi:hypothetical protein
MCALLLAHSGRPLGHERPSQPVLRDNFLARDGDFSRPGKFGTEKQAGLLFDFFRTDSTATPWH